MRAITLTDNIKLNWLDSYEGWIIMLRLNNGSGSFYFPTGPVHSTPERAVSYISKQTQEKGFDGLRDWRQTVSVS